MWLVWMRNLIFFFDLIFFFFEYCYSIQLLENFYMCLEEFYYINICL